MSTYHTHIMCVYIYWCYDILIKNEKTKRKLNKQTHLVIKYTNLYNLQMEMNIVHNKISVEEDTHYPPTLDFLVELSTLSNSSN